MNRTIIVSDLHIDNWTDRKIGSTEISRMQHFFNLLQWCEQQQIREFVINGDLMDLPPYRGNIIFSGESASISRAVVERLIEFARHIKVTYVFGNHDIGISGFRSLGIDSIPSLRNTNFCYPNYVIDDYPGSTILIEHGHFCDPFLLLYARDLNDRTYCASKFEAFEWLMQRREVDHPENVSTLNIPPVVIQPGQNAYYAAKEGQHPLPHKTWWIDFKEALFRLGRHSLGEVTAELWWSAGLAEMQKYIARQHDDQALLKPTLYQIYGHTHRADPRDPVNQDGVSCIYLNGGGWTESLDQGWYLDIDEQGKIWLQDWINEPEILRFNK